MLAAPIIGSIRARAVDVPYERPMQTAAGTMTSASLVLVDLETTGGVTGRAYVRCYTPLVVGPVAELVRGVGEKLEGDRLRPRDNWAELRARFRLLGVEGVVGLALNAIDMASWDALARAADMSLARLLGSSVESVPAYASLRSSAIADVREEVEEAVAAGFQAIKLKVGGRPLAEDYEVLSHVRDLVGDRLDLMCDYNQSLTTAEAEARIRALSHLDLRWVEEPLPASDLEGYRRLAAATTTPIQAGESWWSPEEAYRSIRACASDVVMLDVARVGGVTGWLRAAAVAEAAGLKVSSHTFPEFSAQLLAATANADLLEWLDAAVPLNATPIEIINGAAVVPEGAGAGIVWDEDAVERYAVA